MERRKALALSMVATLMVLAMVGMGVSLVRMTLDSDDRATPLPVITATDGTASATPPGPGGSPAPLDPVVSYLDVYEVLPGSSTTGGAGSGPRDPIDGAVAAPNTPGGRANPAASPPPPPPSPVTPPPSAPTPVTATTAPPDPTSTSVALPPGVPSDWPAGTPIPPMPVGCRQPQLEDNGVWNCQH